MQSYCGCGHTLNLAKLDTITTHFHLTIHASEAFQLMVIIIASQVSGVIHTYLGAIDVLFHKRTVAIHLGCLLWQMPIADPHLNTCYAKLSDSTVRNKTPMIVNDETPTVCNHMTDWNIGIFLILLHREHTYMVGTLRRTVEVKNLGFS